jgi:hypothetical protein
LESTGEKSLAGQSLFLRQTVVVNSRKVTVAAFCEKLWLYVLGNLQ